MRARQLNPRQEKRENDELLGAQVVRDPRRGLRQVDRRLLLALHGPFEGVPATVPIRYVKNQQTWEVVGVFCSWPCAKTWQMTRPAYNSPIQRMWLLEMARKKFGYAHRTIHPAPDAWVLKKFGGDLTVEEFREYTEHDRARRSPPLLPTVMAVVRGEVSDVLGRLSVTQNNVVKKKADKDKKGPPRYLKRTCTRSCRRRCRRPSRSGPRWPPPPPKKKASGKSPGGRASRVHEEVHVRSSVAGG